MADRQEDLGSAATALLVEPDTGERLHFESGVGENPAALVTSSGRRYSISHGIPRFVRTDDPGQVQTADAFGFKWGRLDSYQSAPMRELATAWLLHRYGFASATEMRIHLQKSGLLLDLGCGSGYTTSLWFDGWDSAAGYVGVDISSAIDIAKDRLSGPAGTLFVQADALHLPFPPATFGAVISEGVLHHTPSTQAAIRSAASVIRPGGEFLFYVYRRKSPIREFADDYIRDQIAALGNDEAWTEMESLTHLGRALSELRVEVDLPVEVGTLGIPAGRIDVQRLFYWHFAKAFWNDAYTFDENVHVNFDWYRPAYAHRQTEVDLRKWCDEADLEIFHFDRDPAGFTVRANRRGSVA